MRACNRCVQDRKIVCMHHGGSQVMVLRPSSTFCCHLTKYVQHSFFFHHLNSTYLHALEWVLISQGFGWCWLSIMQVEVCEDGNLYGENSFALYTRHRSFVLIARSVRERDAWVEVGEVARLCNTTLWLYFYMSCGCYLTWVDVSQTFVCTLANNFSWRAKHVYMVAVKCTTTCQRPHSIRP